MSAPKEKIRVPESITRLNLSPKTPVYFSVTGKGFNVYQIVNEILLPYGYESYSPGQFTRIAGGSSNSSNKIPNHCTTNGPIANGYTYIDDIVAFCQNCLDNSVLVPLKDVIGEFEWAKKAINGGYLTLYSNGKTRYDIEAMMDITKGLLNEVAFRIDASRHGINIELNRDFYVGTRNTDSGQDIKTIKIDGRAVTPNIKVQIKDVQYFMLIPKVEFDGDRMAKLFIGYKVHWHKARTGQRFFRSLGGKGEDLFSDFPALEGVRVERRGWAERDDFTELLGGQAYKGMKFNSDNMSVYWDDLKNMESLFPKFLELIA